MRNCGSCKRREYNLDNFEKKIFRCGRNKKKIFDMPHLHGWGCKHYADKIVRKENNNVREN